MFQIVSLTIVKDISTTSKCLR